MKKLIGVSIILFLMWGVGNVNAQPSNAWYDGGSLINVDLCNNPDYGYNWLLWDVGGLEEAYADIGERGPIVAIEGQLEKLSAWLGEHGDGIVNFSVTNPSKVDNILKAIMEIAAEAYDWAYSMGYTGEESVAYYAYFLYWDCYHLLYEDYWD